MAQQIEQFQPDGQDVPAFQEEDLSALAKQELSRVRKQCVRLFFLGHCSKCEHSGCEACNPKKCLRYLLEKEKKEKAALEEAKRLREIMVVNRWIPGNMTATVQANDTDDAVDTCGKHFLKKDEKRKRTQELLAVIERSGCSG